MSTRWYPLYQKGGPQLRVFLPNFWLKVVKPTHDQPPNVVQFACSMQMTKYDIRNYLEKIYNVKVAHVRTRIALGETKKDPGRGYIVKEDDTKLAYVVMHKGESFTFPDIFPEDDKQKEQQEKSLEQAKIGYKNYIERNKNRSNMPGWFTV